MHRDAIAPRLRALGFKGSAGTYVLPDNEWWRVAAFQKDRHSRSDWVRFTVNLALVAKDEWERESAKWEHPRRRPSGGVEAIGYHVRIGNEMPPRGDDRWWEIVPSTPTNEIARAVVSALTSYGLPWLLGGPRLLPSGDWPRSTTLAK